jgi:hypothetical protein
MPSHESRRKLLLWLLLAYQGGLSALAGAISWLSWSDAIRWANSSNPQLKMARILFQQVFAGFAGVVTLGLVVAAIFTLLGLIRRTVPGWLVNWQVPGLIIAGLASVICGVAVPRSEGSHTDLFPGLECFALAAICGLALPAAMAQASMLRHTD